MSSTDRLGACVFIRENEPSTSELEGSFWYNPIIHELKQLFGDPPSWYLHGYAIGDIYITTRLENPNEILGYGTWQVFAFPGSPAIKAWKRLT